MTSQAPVWRAFLVILLLLQPGLSLKVDAHPFLPDTPPAIFAGEHWNDENPGDKPCQAEVSVITINEGSWGKALEVRFKSATQDLLIAPMKWVVLPTGAIYQAEFGDQNAAVKTWTAESVKDALGEMILPPLLIDEERIEFQHGSVKADDEHADSMNTAERVQWSRGPTRTAITLDPTQQTLRYSFRHNSGHFTTIVWQRGLGIVHVGMGSGARQDGWSLSRTLAPTIRPGSGNLPKDPDIIQLFVLLPKDAMPVMHSMPQLSEPSKRDGCLNAKTDDERRRRAEAMNTRDWTVLRDAGYLRVSSIGDGEGQALEAAMWKRPDGKRLIGLHLLNWTAGPESTADLRFYEWRDQRFRLATFRELLLPEPVDFVEDEAQASQGGHLAGTWKLPERGTTITVRPEGEQLLMIEESPEIKEDYSFEFLWDGNNFRRVTLPRQLAVEGREPVEWIFQGSGETPDMPVGTLFLKREGDHFKGELRGHQREPVSMEITPSGREMPIKLGTRKAGAANFTELMESPFEPWSLRVVMEGEAEPRAFESVPQAAGGSPIPRFTSVRQKQKVGVASILADSIEFDSSKSHALTWKQINQTLAEAVARQIAAGRKALQTNGKITEDMEVAIRQRLLSIDDQRLDIRMEVLTHAGPGEGTQEIVSLNFDTATGKTISLASMFRATGWEEKMIKLVHEKLLEQEVIEPGQTPVTAELLNRVAWHCTPVQGLTLTFPMRALGPSADEASVTFSLTELAQSGLRE